MACGDSYARILRTADGRTPADPCESWGPLCLTGSYDGWYVTVSSVVAREVKRRIEVLSRANGPIPGDLRSRLDDFFVRLEELPSSSITAPFTLDRPLIDSAIAVGREGLCLMEILDGEIEAAGLEVPTTAGSTDPKLPTPGPIESAMSTIAVGVAFVGAVWIAWKVARI